MHLMLLSLSHRVDIKLQSTCWQLSHPFPGASFLGEPPASSPRVLALHGGIGAALCVFGFSKILSGIQEAAR